MSYLIVNEDIVLQTWKKGRPVIRERPLLKCENLPVIGSGRPTVASSLSQNKLQQFARLPAGPGHAFRVPVEPRVDVKSHFAAGNGRLMNTVQYNEIWIVTARCPMVGFHTAAVSHSCSPNAYLCYNKDTDSLGLFLVRHVKKGEEITISYFQDDYAVPQSVRARRLQKWNFVCTCVCCTTNSDMSDFRRMEIKRLFTERNQLDIALSMHHIHLAPQWGGIAQREVNYVWDIATCIRMMIRHMKAEGLYGLAMTWVLVDYAEHCVKTGDLRTREAVMEEALVIREMCLGLSHPSTLYLANRTW
ncbi:uncharacterized protein PG998_006077 [Apiospora kogelbergensis]|uniref:uncharacterized protein n=1 Tax=Apiospora kogelbergensis TaxID=1337665 RepID=UPI00312DD012